MDEQTEQQGHGNPQQIAEIHDLQRMNSGEQPTQQKRGRHLNWEENHVQGCHRHSLHSLVDELEGRSAFRGENTDSVGEQN